VLEALIAPHLSYAKLMQIVLKVVEVRGMAHITGGGITENLPRILPEGTAATIRLDAWTVPPVFTFLKETGGVSDKEMLRTFNLGQGMLFVVPAEQVAKAQETVELAGQTSTVIGEIVEGDGSVHYEGNLVYG